MGLKKWQCCLQYHLHIFANLLLTPPKHLFIIQQTNVGGSLFNNKNFFYLFLLKKISTAPQDTIQ